MTRSPAKAPLTPSPREVELALDAPRAVVEAVASGGGALGGRAATRRLRSLYFDTPEGALFAAGLALRVRQDGARVVQTVKRRGAPIAGLFEREESETKLASPEPDLARIADPALRACACAACGESALAPVLETEFTRVARRVAFEDARIEVACDVGEARVPAGSFPISQVELELLAGEPGALFRLAAALREKHPELRPAASDKTEAAFAALRGAPPAPVRARPLALDEEASLDALLGASLAECVRCVTGNEAAALAGEDAEGVHQMRVGVRRLRALLRLLADELPSGRAAALRDALEPLAAALGAVRDLDVFLALLAECEASGEVSLAALRARCGEDRARAQAALRHLLAAPESAQLALELGSLAYAAEWRTPESAARLAEPAPALALAARADRRALKAGRGFASLDAAALHKLRIRVKGARYAAALLAPLLPGKRARRYARRAAELQDLLGAGTDAADARALLARYRAAGDSDGAAFVAGFVAHRAAQARAELPRAWRRFRRMRRAWD